MYPSERAYMQIVELMRKFSIPEFSIKTLLSLAACDSLYMRNGRLYCCSQDERGYEADDMEEQFPEVIVKLIIYCNDHHSGRISRMCFIRQMVAQCLKAFERGFCSSPAVHRPKICEGCGATREKVIRSPLIAWISCTLRPPNDIYPINLEPRKLRSVRPFFDSLGGLVTFVQLIGYSLRKKACPTAHRKRTGTFRRKCLNMVLTCIVLSPVWYIHTDHICTL